ncbi:hypothetical protein OFO10_05080 [Campylobacter sp. VBCF_06 NA8]|uniref:hypothetical protein n=1 Tax=Campylobacter sp. VBCF_06 NA8 TaxID=2983822 RepID=UPI0022E9FB93|nr:hypothetical protein [Campylobacter sp. VBCF_06 NA8]MDA3046525.1 hypothetical protein [Campylobacter sp. VBCF_06 NA8]
MSLRDFVESEAIYEYKILCGEFAKIPTLNFSLVDCHETACAVSRNDKLEIKEFF